MSPVRREYSKKPAGKCRTCGDKGYTVRKWWSPPWFLPFRTQVLCRTCNGSGTPVPRKI